MTEVAVVVPTHDRPELLAVTLQSIVAQRDVDMAVAVVDDGSSNPRSVREVVEAFGDSRVSLVRHEAPRGVCAARNTGISHTASEWVAFCDDDDVWAPEKLTSQLAAARSAAAQWVYTGQVSIDGELRVRDGAAPLEPRALVQELEYYNPVPAGSSNVMVRRSVLDVVGWFDPTLRSVGDWDMWIRLSRSGLPACVPDPLVRCRLHGHDYAESPPHARGSADCCQATPGAGGLASSSQVGRLEQHARRTQVRGAWLLRPRRPARRPGVGGSCGHRARLP